MSSEFLAQHVKPCIQGFASRRVLEAPAAALTPDMEDTMPKAAACVITNCVVTVSDINTTVNCEPRVHDLRLADALGFSDRHMIRNLIRRHIATLEAFGEVSVTRTKPTAKGGRPGTDYWLNKRQALFITAKSDTERAALVTVQMVEVFDAVTRGQTVALPQPQGMMPVRAYQRAPRKSAMFDGSQKGRGCVVLDEPVFFDAGRIPAAGEPALVVMQDGRLAVLPVARPSDPGFVMVEDRPPGWSRMAWAKVALVGAVTTPAGRAMIAR